MKSPCLHLDFETFSETDLKKVGSARYAFDPSTEILCAAMALDDGEPDLWSQLDDGGGRLERYWDALENPEVLIWAHSAQFEMFICQALLWRTWGVKCPDLRRFRCTASLARRAALPASLEKLGEVLQLEHLKDKKGKSLIRKFSMLPTRATKANPTCRRIRPEDDVPAFTDFCNYCKQDIRAEQGAKKKLSYFDDPINSANYSLDAIINARGVTVNLDALRHAQKLIDEETEIVSAKFRKLVGFEVTQGARLMSWMFQEGAQIENLQAETIDEYLEKEKVCDRCEGAGQTFTKHDIIVEGILSCPACGGTTAKPIIIEALRLKQSIAYASIKKVKTMIACAGPHDNRIRGMLTHHGATTGRWTSSLVQFQNLKRATVKHTEEAYRDICNGISREMLELCYGPVLEVISSCVRHFVEDRQ